jgi:membrane protein oxaA
MILFIYNKSRGIKTMKKYILFCYFLLLSNILTGCSSNDTDGFFYNTFTKNMDMFLSNINVYVKSWGVSIIIITLIVKGIILPFMLKNYKKQRTSSINMEKAKPELDLVQSKIKKLSEDQKRAFNNDERMKIRIEQTELQKELFKIYKKYDCSPAIFGNLIPILIQAPFISGLYFTLQNPIYSKDILDSSFLSISLGEKSYILLILVFVIYMIVGKISQSMMQSNPMSQTTPEAERIQNVSKNMVWITPIMLTFLTYTSIAAIGIYFVVSGILVTFQILLGRKLYPPYVPKPVKTSNKQKTKLVKR